MYVYIYIYREREILCILKQQTTRKQAETKGEPAGHARENKSRKEKGIYKKSENSLKQTLNNKQDIQPNDKKKTHNNE